MALSSPIRSLRGRSRASQRVSLLSLSQPNKPSNPHHPRHRSSLTNLVNLTSPRKLPPQNREKLSVARIIIARMKVLIGLVVKAPIMALIGEITILSAPIIRIVPRLIDIKRSLNRPHTPTNLHNSKRRMTPQSRNLAPVAGLHRLSKGLHPALIAVLPRAAVPYLRAHLRLALPPPP